MGRVMVLGYYNILPKTSRFQDEIIRHEKGKIWNAYIEKIDPEVGISR